VSRWRWGKLQGSSLPTLQGSGLRTITGRPGTEGPNAAVYRSERWRRLRAELIKAHPYCARCNARGVRLYADHKRELRDGGPAFDPSNIEILCSKCHGAKTVEARRARGLA
jgi:hypothetical protein